MKEIINPSKEYIRSLHEKSKDLTTEQLMSEIQSLTDKRISEIRNTKTDVEVKGTAYYVANEGSDDNDGKSPETAWQTPERVTLAKRNEELVKGDVVFFKRGQLFRGYIETANGVTYSAFGEGEKPRVYGFPKNVADPALWIETDVPGVWQYAEICDLDIGSIVFYEKTYARKIYRSLEDDGTQLDSGSDYKPVFNDYHDLREDLTFWHDWKREGDFTGKLYLRCDAGNPGKVYDDIEFSKRESVFRNLGSYDVTIDNIHIAHGCFGVSGLCHNQTIQNCEFSWIGGNVQDDARKLTTGRTFPTPYGNGIEIYGEAQNFTVDNCYFWQIYDAAMTHQCGNSAHPIHNRNVNYINNVCEYCVYSVEIFYGESPVENRSNYGCNVENNILRLGGGFGHDSRPDKGVTALIRNGRMILNTKDYVVRNNIFDRSRGKLIQAGNDGASKAQYYDNLYVQTKGSKFCTRLGKDYIATKNVKAELEETATEHGAQIRII
ncbi:MAG: hypothetical protein E7583_01030 [Ruminococcaceae bacterium]|nr:hypothetical protein [Oscillospiraceae bacterium]